MNEKDMEKELKKYFKENGVPTICSSEFYYIMFMPRGLREVMKKLFFLVLIALAVPAVLLLLLWNTIFLGFNYDKKVLLSIVLGAVWIVLFIVIYFLIYVNTKIRFLEHIREGRKYRDQIKRNTDKTNKKVRR
jgi:amino acid transporter